MQLVEQHCIRNSDLRYRIIDEAAFKSKNLYNAALYEMRQAFIHHGIHLSYEKMDKRMQPHEAYRALPAKVSQHVLKQLADAWKAFREAKAANEEDPSKFTGRPRLPKYKHKTEGRNMLVYTVQAISRSKRCLQRGVIKPSMLHIEIKTKQDPKQITNKRNRQVNHYLHATSKCIIDFLVKQGVGTIIVGKNPLWKQEAGMGKRNNQNFVQIPHARFIDMLMYTEKPIISHKKRTDHPCRYQRLLQHLTQT